MKTIGIFIALTAAGAMVGFYVGVAILMMWPAIRTSLGW
jgi:MFS superfamily sulfate permease-like transporter